MKTNRFLPLLVLTCVFFGCGSEGSPDAEFEDALEDGKADSVYGECEIRELLAWLNDPATGYQDLRDASVHARAARNIVDHRNGPDVQPGTEDDDPFDSAEELDDVPYVGKTAFEKLVAAVAERCAQRSQVEVVFSPQPYEQSHLVKTAGIIDTATRSIDIAMYSFSDSRIFNALKRAVERGVSIRILFEPANEERKKPEGTMSARLEDAGIDVRYITKIMHHKFMLVDGPRDGAAQAQEAQLTTGSGNWSNSAGTRYDENTVFISGNNELVLRFQKEFNHLWENSRDFVWNQGLQYFASASIGDEMIADDPGVDTRFTSANFDKTTTSAGPSFKTVAGRNEIADKLVELIQGANRSIHIASGHLRSRPVSEALLAKHQANPDMDIRIYLDDQEYIGTGKHDEQVRTLQQCLDEAGDDLVKQQKCQDSGFYYSYQVHSEGIPLRFKFYAYRWHYSYAVQMHHKYFVFDERTLATGSYNLSDNAEHNTMENMVIYEGSAFVDLVAAFEQNFEQIWVTGEAEGKYEALLNRIQDTTEDVPLVFDSMALSWDQVNALKAAIRTACPAADSAEYRDAPETHQYCER